MNLEIFHPAVARWFGKSFPAATPPQAQAWPAIKERRNTLIAAPTGSGKTLAAFLAAIDDLVRLGVEGNLDIERSLQRVQETDVVTSCAVAYAASVAPPRPTS